MAAEDRKYHIGNHVFPRIANDIIHHPVWIRPLTSSTTVTTTTTSTTTTEATTLNETATNGALNVAVQPIDAFSPEVPLQQHVTDFSAVARTENEENRRFQMTTSTKPNLITSSSTKKKSNKEKKSKKDKSKRTKSKKTTSSQMTSNKKASYAVTNNATTENILQNLGADKKVNGCLRVTVRPLMVHVSLMLYAMWFYCNRTVEC